MANIPIPNGAKVAIASTFGLSKNITAFTNANPSVATSTAHGLQAGAVVLLSTPGWSDIDNQVRHATAVTADAVTFGGLDASSVDAFPAGGGVGSMRAITAWTQLPFIPSFERTGGEAKTKTSEYIDVEKDREFFIGTTAERLNFKISYAPDSPAFSALLSCKSSEISVVRLTLKDGSKLYYSGQMHFNSTPVTTKDQEMVCSASMALQASITRFASV